jgi:hypothetical protein
MPALSLATYYWIHVWCFATICVHSCHSHEACTCLMAGSVFAWPLWSTDSNPVCRHACLSLHHDLAEDTCLCSVCVCVCCSCLLLTMCTCSLLLPLISTFLLFLVSAFIVLNKDYPFLRSSRTLINSDSKAPAAHEHQTATACVLRHSAATCEYETASSKISMQTLVSRAWIFRLLHESKSLTVTVRECVYAAFEYSCKHQIVAWTSVLLSLWALFCCLHMKLQALNICIHMQPHAQLSIQRNADKCLSSW